MESVERQEAHDVNDERENLHNMERFESWPSATLNQRA